MPPSRSFLGRVTKYVPRHGLDPAENRLTEVTAGVLEHADGFAVPFVASLLDLAADDLEARAKVAANDGRSTIEQRAIALRELRELRRRVDAHRDRRVEVRTQVGTSSGRFVDLELRLRPALLHHDSDLVLWVEVKHGASLTGDQLEAYKHEVPTGGVVLVVAPLQSMPDVPPHMPVVPWQRLADVVRTHRSHAGVGTDVHFILDAYATYLREEKLMDDALTTGHALALEHHAGAERVLWRLCELADSLVVDAWNDRTKRRESRGKAQYGPGWWVTYHLQRRGVHEPSATWGTGARARMEWVFRDDAGRGQEARGTVAFAAGASWDLGPNNPVARAENAGWVNARRNDGFAVGEDHSRFQRMWAFLYPEQLLVETTLEGQARYLADWVVGRFEAVTAVPPPM